MKKLTEEQSAAIDELETGLSKCMMSGVLTLMDSEKVDDFTEALQCLKDDQEEEDEEEIAEVMNWLNLSDEEWDSTPQSVQEKLLSTYSNVLNQI